MCRATKVGRSKDPSFCESQAADFLQCYHEMTAYVKKNCQSQYTNAFDCLKQADQKSMLSPTNKGQVDKCEKAMNGIKLC